MVTAMSESSSWIGREVRDRERGQSEGSSQRSEVWVTAGVRDRDRCLGPYWVPESGLGEGLRSGQYQRRNSVKELALGSDSRIEAIRLSLQFSKPP